MPGERKHHTEKFRRCVEEVMAKGNSEDSAYAICTTSLREAGESIFEAAEEFQEMRHLHLAGCASKAEVRTENGVEYIVVPVVALMEGVIHAVNAETPEFVPLSTLKEAAESWNGKPVTIGHPKKNGTQCSASDPVILEAHGIGNIRNSRIVGTKMMQEAWVVKDKVKKLHPEMHDRLLDAQHEEVSVGAYVIVNEKDGNHNGKKYKKTWLRAGGDHLAFLPGGRGACSIEMGCGAHRAAAATYFVAAEEFIPIDENFGNELLRMLETFVAAAGARHSSSDNAMIQAIHDQAMKLGASCDRGNYVEPKIPRIKNEGGLWVLYSKDGVRRLASHATETEANEHLTAIEAAAHRRSLELQEVSR